MERRVVLPAPFLPDQALDFSAFQYKVDVVQDLFFSIIDLVNAVLLIYSSFLPPSADSSIMAISSCFVMPKFLASAMRLLM